MSSRRRASSAMASSTRSWMPVVSSTAAECVSELTLVLIACGSASRTSEMDWASAPPEGCSSMTSSSTPTVNGDDDRSRAPDPPGLGVRYATASTACQPAAASTNAARRSRWTDCDSDRLSACHCTPTTKRAVGSSIASMTPSGAQPTARSPLPSRSMRLVVERVHLDLRRPGDGRDAAALLEADGVRRDPAGLLLAVAQRARSARSRGPARACRRARRSAPASRGRWRRSAARAARPRARARARTRRSRARSDPARDAARRRRCPGADRGRPSAAGRRGGRRGDR